MTSYVEKLLTLLSVSVTPGSANSGEKGKSDPSENNKIEESEILTYLYGPTDITDKRVKNGFRASKNAGMDDAQKVPPPPTSPNRILTEVWSGRLGGPEGVGNGSPESTPTEGAAAEPNYAPPSCMECGRVGGVVYIEFEGGDLLCGSCYAATLRELAERVAMVEKRAEKKKERK